MVIIFEFGNRYLDGVGRYCFLGVVYKCWGSFSNEELNIIFIGIFGISRVNWGNLEYFVKVRVSSGYRFFFYLFRLI